MILRVLLLSFALSAAFLIVACGEKDRVNGRQEVTSQSAESRPSAAAAETPVPALYVIGNDRGFLRPCGCSKPVLGGIDRRLAFFEKLPAAVRSESAIIACGNLVITGGRQQELKIESFLQAMSAMGVSAYCVGDQDLHLGASYWSDSAAQIATFPLVSLNLEKDQKPLFRPFAVLSAKGREMVVSGYISPESSALTEPGLRALRDPDAGALKEALRAGAGGRPRTLVIWTSAPLGEVSGFLDRSGLGAAAQQTLILQSSAADLPTFTRIDAGRALLEVGTKGRYVASLPTADLGRADRHVLDQEVGKSALGGELLQLYRDAVGFEELLKKAPTLGSATDVYAGDQRCRECHTEADRIWAASGHAHAWKTLETTGDTRDPECVRCHVTGYGQIGGFTADPPAPTNVLCEACHGPSDAHSQQASTKTPLSQPDASVCIRCHDVENSPGFRFETYWPKIRHGKEK